MTLSTYISVLPLDTSRVESSDRGRRDREISLISKTPPNELPDFEEMNAAINVGSVVTFVDGLSLSERSDVLYSMQIAQRAANARFDRYFDTGEWYRVFTQVLENIGWATQQFAFVRHEQQEGEVRMDRAALAVIADIATQQQLNLITRALSTLEELADDNGDIGIFESQSSNGASGNFQIGSAEKSVNNEISLSLGVYYFHANDARRRFLFFSWGGRDINLWMATQTMTLNKKIYDTARESIQQRLSDAGDYVKRLEIN